MANPLILPQIFQSPSIWQTPGIGDNGFSAVDGYMSQHRGEGIVAGDDQMPEPPRMPQKRRGLFGGKVDMEDFQMALARAAAYFQGDYAGAAEITGYMGKARQGRLDAAQLGTMLAQDDSLTEQQRQMFAMAPEKYFEYATGRLKAPERTNAYKEYIDAGYTDAQAQEQLRLDAETRRTKYFPMSENGSLAAVEPGQPPRTVIAQGVDGVPMGTPVGGGGIPRVNSPDEAKRLPPGSRFMTPDGRIGTVPGGGVSNGPGNFRP